MKSVTRHSRNSECTFEWKIEDFDKAMKLDNKNLISSSFTIPGQSCKFILRVKEATEKHNNGTSNRTPSSLYIGGSNQFTPIKWYFAVTLEGEGEGESIKAAATLEVTNGEGVMKGNFGDAASHNFHIGDKHQFLADHDAKYLNTSGFKATASNFYNMGETSLLTLRATITIPGKLLTSMEAEAEDTNQLFNFRPLLTDPKFADITFKCQDRVFPCHRNILSSR